MPHLVSAFGGPATSLAPRSSRGSGQRGAHEEKRAYEYEQDDDGVAGRDELEYVHLRWVPHAGTDVLEDLLALSQRHSGRMP